MIRLFAAVWLSILTFACAYSVDAASAIPPGSFIRVEVQSVDQLVKQVQNDPVVRKRYASHFGVSPEYLVEYLRSEVELVTLREPLKTQVWYIGKDGRIFSKTKLLPRGSQVFANKQGKPLILWRCGNPLTSALPERPQPVEQAPSNIETLVKPGIPQVAAIAPILAPPVSLVTPTLPATVASAASVAAGPIAAVPSIVSAGGAGFPWLSAVAGVGGLAAIAGSGGSGGGDTVREPPPPAVPEPPTVILTILGLIPTALMAVRRGRG